MFCITAMETEDDDAMTEDIRISMHALTGIAPSNTIRLLVQINRVNLSALVDSDATHTFIHDDVARRLGLDIKRRPSL
jgi:hypothetical protein